MAKCGKFGNFLWQNLAIFVAKFGKIWDFKWQFSAMPGLTAALTTSEITYAEATTSQCLTVTLTTSEITSTVATTTDTLHNYRLSSTTEITIV